MIAIRKNQALGYSVYEPTHKDIRRALKRDPGDVVAARTGQTD